MKIRFFSWILVLTALPFFMGVECCCFAKEVSQPDSYSEAEKTDCDNPSTASCDCSSIAFLAQKENRVTAKLQIPVLKNLFLACGDIHSSKPETPKPEEPVQELAPQPPPNFIYLSFFHAHAPPIA